MLYAIKQVSSFSLVHRSKNNWTNAKNVFLRVLFKKRRRSGLRRGFLNGTIGKMGKHLIQLFKIRCTSKLKGALVQGRRGEPSSADMSV